MENAYEEIKRCIKNKKHNVSTETLELALEALRIVIDTVSFPERNDHDNNDLQPRV